MSASVPGDPWAAHARQWERVGAPLRPSAEDLAIVAREAARCAQPPRVLLLGVTPELAAMAWPEGTALLAVDRSAEMIAAVWPRERVPRGARAVQADWRALPAPDASFDLVVGDGVFTVLAFPDDVSAVASEIARVLAPGGRAVVRAFVAPGAAESLEALARDAREGRIASFHALKWRLAMALATPAGVRLGDVWDTWHALGRPGASRWNAATTATIDAYRGSEARYAFPTLDALLRALTPLGLLQRAEPTYELGARCPTLMLARDA